jgi:AhpD family alkylhydroperoxidase
MSSTDTFKQSLTRAREYGLEEFLEIISEMSQVSTRKGIIDRKNKELITLGMALTKQCRRCIDIHTKEAIRLHVMPGELTQVRKIALFLKASPREGGEMWDSWEDSWREYVLGRGPIQHHVRELIALGIASGGAAPRSHPPARPCRARFRCTARGDLRGHAHRAADGRRAGLVANPASRRCPRRTAAGHDRLNRVQSDMRRFHCAFGFGDSLDLSETRFRI